MNENIFVQAWHWFLDRAKNEPAMLVEDFRLLLFALPVLIGFALDAEQIGAMVTVFSVVVSRIAEKRFVRDKVTPTAKLTGAGMEAEVGEVDGV